MSKIKVTDLAPEINLTELQTNSIVGGFGFSSRRRKRRSGSSQNNYLFRENFQFQSNVSTSQGNSAIGVGDKQDNYSDINIYFL